MIHHDVIIVGAGAAGIACAKALQGAGIDFLLIEARDRIGGRILSLQDPEYSQPLELGAEFIHGAPQLILQQMHAHSLPFYDVQDDHLFLRDNQLVRVDFWQRLDQVVKSAGGLKRDRSIAEFLAHKKNLSRETVSLFTSFVEGFHAADLHILGERGLKEASETDETELNGAQIFRPAHRYDQLFHKLFAALKKRGHTLLHTRLRTIDWKPGQATLTCESGPNNSPVKFRCTKLVLTVPLGVLKSRDLEWIRPLDGLAESLSALHMGHVQRIIFRMRERFWENLSDGPVAFLHTGPQFYFPTWWSLQPMRTPFLVSWQGGPKAQELAQLSERQQVQAALKTLAQLTGRSANFLNARVEAWYTHNWSNDPFAQGAYSYVGAGGVKAAHRLQRPFANTIHFAGEACAEGSSRGTVHGAYASGHQTGMSLAAAL